MGKLLRRLWNRQRRNGSEHGAVAVIVAVLLSGGVLLSSGALVVDIGLLYVEQEQLQSGADAASYAIAISCAKGNTCTAAAQTATAVSYAKKNALDGAANAQICINGTGCPTWNTAITCPPMPTPAAGTVVGNYVEVRTTTVTSSGSTLIPPVFAGALTGTSYAGKQVGACARVNWGPPANSGLVLAIGISLCDWKRMTGNGTVYYGLIGSLLSQLGLYSTIGLPAPVSGQDSAIPAVLPLVTLGLPLPSCTTPVDLTVPRGWVILSAGDGATVPDNNCMVNLNVGDYPKSFLLAMALLGPNGQSIGANCAAELAKLAAKGLPVLVPIYDVIQQALLSATPAYHIVGFAPFVVTGYTTLLGGLLSGVGSVLSGSIPSALNNILCGGSTCIYGYFTKTLVPQSHASFGTGTNFGATLISRTG